ncbi:hypothetical protein DM860_001973 [Cuscuta australis]|uniref:Myricetin 7/4'-O-methyltransferase 2 n=1 Tax=Cuscuta australis TaxID=267555 RepID=A0A328DVI2_9ASTE|nr:hypothetical protein DM860_001973 [Cuscuta australis]
MEANSRPEATMEMLQAQAHIYRYTFGYVNSMVLCLAIQLNIPDIIHAHGKPITVPHLLSALKLAPAKSHFIRSLMRLLTHNGFFDSRKINEEDEEEGYVLTASSRLLLKNQVPNLSPFVLIMTEQVTLGPWHVLTDWLSRKDELGPFEIANGVPFWNLCDTNPGLSTAFNEAMSSNTRMACFVLKDCGHVFEGLKTLVDVGGGTGMIAKLILEVFPSLKCTVLDLPRVVADLPQSDNLRFLGGDMFHSIPPADAIMLKHIMHDWSDEDCVKILKKCREAIINNGAKGGKVIIIDIVIGKEKDTMTEVKLMYDTVMMVLLAGRERTEKEWERLFTEARFTRYTIKPIFGIWSLIEVFP